MDRAQLAFPHDAARVSFQATTQFTNFTFLLNFC